MQQRALADTRCADDRHHLARLDRQIQIAQDVQALGSDLIALVDVVSGEKSHLTRELLSWGSRELGDTPSSVAPQLSSSVVILVSFDLIVERCRAAADGRACKRALPAADQRANARARPG